MARVRPVIAGMPTDRIVVRGLVHEVTDRYRAGAVARRRGEGVGGAHAPDADGAEWRSGWRNEDLGEHLRHGTDVIAASPTGTTFEEDPATPRRTDGRVSPGWYACQRLNRSGMRATVRDMLSAGRPDRYEICFALRSLGHDLDLRLAETALDLVRLERMKEAARRPPTSEGIDAAGLVEPQECELLVALAEAMEEGDGSPVRPETPSRRLDREGVWAARTLRRLVLAGLGRLVTRTKDGRVALTQPGWECVEALRDALDAGRRHGRADRPR